jgi:hypothetical protein
MALTEHCNTPKMPWGINPGELAELVRGWREAIAEVAVTARGPSRGIVAAPVLGKLPALADLMPSIVTVPHAKGHEMQLSTWDLDIRT